MKDKLLGELIVITVSVNKDWEYVQGKHTQTRVRDIEYRWKRKKLPFAYPKVYLGIQCTDETAYPLSNTSRYLIVDINDEIFERNRLIQAKNERHDRHQQLKASIINHQFQEYDHEHGKT